MKKPVAITASRDLVPAQRLLLCALAAAFLLLPATMAGAETRTGPHAGPGQGTIHGKSAVHGKRTSHTPPVPAEPAVVAAKVAPAVQVANAPESRGAAKDADLSAADEFVGASSYAMAGSQVRLPKDAGQTVGSVTTTPVSRPAGAIKRAGSAKAAYQWYPESHNYLRPYRYRWRYWTPG